MGKLSVSCGPLDDRPLRQKLFSTVYDTSSVQVCLPRVVEGWLDLCVVGRVKNMCARMCVSMSRVEDVEFRSANDPCK